GVLEDGHRVERRPLAGVHLRCHAVGVRRTAGPPSVRVLTRQKPGDRDLRARIVDRASRVDRAKHEQDVRLVEERERDLAPQIARLGAGRICAAGHSVREEELDAAAKRAFYLARAACLGKRSETPHQTRVAPRARLVVVDPARGIELLGIADQSLHERLEALVIAVSGERDVAHDVADEARRPVVLVEDPAHAALIGRAQVVEHATRRAAHAWVPGVDAVLDEQQIRPVRRLVLRAVEMRARPAAVGLLLAQECRERWAGHRALLRLAELGIARTAVEHVPQRERSDRRVALLEEPGDRVVVQKRLPRHHVPPTDSSAMTSVGLPIPPEPNVRSVPTPLTDESRCVRLPAIVMPCTGFTGAPRSMYVPLAPSENSPDTGSMVWRLRSEVTASARSSPRTRASGSSVPASMSKLDGPMRLGDAYEPRR